MSLLSWRARKVISDRLPPLYHPVANAGVSGNGPEHWDARLAETWDTRQSPEKTERIRTVARRDQVRRRETA